MHTVTTLTNKYNVSRSTVYNIKKNGQQRLLNRNWRKIIRISDDERNNLVDAIKLFISKSSEPYTIKDIQDYLDEHLNKHYPYHKIRQIMKFSLNLTFKRVSSRSAYFNHSKMKWIRGLYWTYFIQNLKKSDLILNVDECTVGRSTKMNYSWGSKGKSIECKNINIESSVKIILTIASKGMWHCLITKETINGP